MSAMNANSAGEFVLQAQSSFSGLQSGAAAGGGVVASDGGSPALALVRARRGCVSELTRRVQGRFGIDLPAGPQRAEGSGVAFMGIAVETWLATAPAAERATFTASLRGALDEVAAVCDQSGAYAMLKLSGTRVREALAKFIAIDLHPEAFRPGAVGATVGGHIPLTLWRCNDAADALPVFELAVPRSYSASFWHMLTTSSAEFGFVLE